MLVFERLVVDLLCLWCIPGILVWAIGVMIDRKARWHPHFTVFPVIAAIFGWVTVYWALVADKKK